MESGSRRELCTPGVGDLTADDIRAICRDHDPTSDVPEDGIETIIAVLKLLTTQPHMSGRMSTRREKVVRRIAEAFRVGNQLFD